MTLAASTSMWPLPECWVEVASKRPSHDVNSWLTWSKFLWVEIALYVSAQDRLGGGRVGCAAERDLQHGPPDSLPPQQPSGAEEVEVQDSRSAASDLQNKLDFGSRWHCSHVPGPSIQVLDDAERWTLAGWRADGLLVVPPTSVSEGGGVISFKRGGSLVLIFCSTSTAVAAASAHTQ